MYLMQNIENCLKIMVTYNTQVCNILAYHNTIGYKKYKNISTIKKLLNLIAKKLKLFSINCHIISFGVAHNEEI